MNKDLLDIISYSLLAGCGVMVGLMTHSAITLKSLILLILVLGFGYSQRLIGKNSRELKKEEKK